MFGVWLFSLLGHQIILPTQSDQSCYLYGPTQNAVSVCIFVGIRVYMVKQRRRKIPQDWLIGCKTRNSQYYFTVCIIKPPQR